MKPATTPRSKTRLVDIDTLRLWEGNYNEGDVGAIAYSVERFGFRSVFKRWRETTMCGNHTQKALWSLHARGPLPETEQWEGYRWPPAGIVEKAGRWFVERSRLIEMDDLSKDEAIAYAIADNHLAQMAAQDQKLLAKYLTKLAKQSSTLLKATGFELEDLEFMVGQLALDEAEQEGIDEITGELLGKLRLKDITPRHTVEHGQVWRLGEHILVIAGLIEEWPLWSHFLRDDILFCPHPSPLVTLTPKAQLRRLLLVTPDEFVGAHVLDRYEDIYGSKKIRQWPT